ncbi:cation transporting ATPase C-terminal domain-containing protein [Candidatus Saccharibacteria bacterium]|nr:cation transporting ATPase C-terminal domain-containing protein [Candidatus Saccharibacteria bacterium]
MVIPLGLEPGEKTVMKQRPISPTAPLFTKYMISRIVLVAGVMAVLALSLYAYFEINYDHGYAQTMVFTALVVIQWANAFNARSLYESAFSRLRTWSRPFWIGLTLAVTLQLIALFGPLQSVFHIHPVSLGHLALVSGIAFLSAILVVEIHKAIGRKLYQSREDA